MQGSVNAIQLNNQNEYTVLKKIIIKIKQVINKFSRNSPEKYINSLTKAKDIGNEIFTNKP